MARQSLYKCFYVPALSFLFQPQAQCPSRSPLGWILTLRHSIKEQINLGGICMTGWKDCIYITKPGGVSWFPSPCISFSCGFQVGVDRRTHQPFFSSQPHSLASAQSRGVLLEQGHSTHRRHPGVGVYRNRAPVDDNTLAGKTTSGKQILSLSPKTRHINSLYFNTQTLHITLTLFNCTSLTVSLSSS